MTKVPLPTEMSKGQSDNTNNVTKKLDYTAIVDRLRTNIIEASHLNFELNLAITVCNISLFSVLGVPFYYSLLI